MSIFFAVFLARVVNIELLISSQLYFDIKKVCYEFAILISSRFWLEPLSANVFLKFSVGAFINKRARLLQSLVFFSFF